MTEPFRLTVAAIVVRPINPVSSPYPPVLLQWPRKAAEQWEANLSTVQGGVETDETDPLTAMKRELAEELGLPLRQIDVYPVQHPDFCIPETRKRYVWFLIRCRSPVALLPNPAEVAAADWYYCPQTLRLGIQQMHATKARMFQQVFAAACHQHPEFFGAYVPLVNRARRRRLKQAALTRG